MTKLHNYTYESLQYFYDFCITNKFINEYENFYELLKHLIKNNIIDYEILKIYNKKMKQSIDNKYIRVEKKGENLSIGDTILWYSQGQIKTSIVNKILPSFIKINDYDLITRGKLGYERKIYIINRREN